MKQFFLFLLLLLPVQAQFIGSESCSACHKPQFEAWQKSHHAKSMMKPTRQSVLAPFMGEAFEEFRFFQLNGKFMIEAKEVEYTFGFTPLQQYLVKGERGRLQAFPIAYNVVEKKWYRLETSDKHYTSPNNTWNFMCADCHSTNFSKNYSFETDSYDSKFSEVNVGCEACHGAGANHAKDNKIKFEKPKQEVCAECHSHRTQIAPRGEGQALFKSHIPTPLFDGLYGKNGEMVAEVFTYGSFIQSKMYEKGVSCNDCHLPHSGTLKIEGNGLCHQCHAPEKPHFKAEADCKSCHMPTKIYMGIDKRHDHAFKIPNKNDVPLLKRLMTTNSLSEIQTALKSNDFNVLFAAISRVEKLQNPQKSTLLTPLRAHENAFIRQKATGKPNEQSLWFNSDRAESLNDLAMLKSDKIEAIKLLETAKQRDPKFIYTYFNLAFIYQGNDEMKVLENLNEALKIEPQNATALNLLALHKKRVTAQ